MGDESGGVDKRIANRIAAHFSVNFREIGEAEAEELSDKMALAQPPGPSQAPPSPPLPGPQPAGQAQTENISQGGLSLTGDLEILGDRKLEKGKKLLVEFHLPGESRPVTAVAAVIWSIEGKAGQGAHGKFTAGLVFTGIEDKDLEKIQRYVGSKAG